MTKEKIEEIASLSYSILDNVSKYLKVGGELVYSTCTITKIENELQIKKFLSNHKNFEKIEEHLIIPSKEIIQDGFYLCKLKKIGD